MRKMMLLAAMVAIAALMLAAAPAMAQEISRDSEQEAESGDVDQSFEVTSEGDNSNQTAGIQGVSNTGNTQNQIGVIDAGGDFDNGDDFFDNGDEFCDDEFDDEFCEELEDFCDDFDDDGFCDFFFDDDNNRFFFGDDDFFDDGNRFFGDDDGFGNFGDDEDGSSIEVSPTNVTSSDQQVNQAATAAG
jgi:opacity protein-like surface antigen